MSRRIEIKDTEQNINEIENNNEENNKTKIWFLKMINITAKSLVRLMKRKENTRYQYKELKSAYHHRFYRYYKGISNKLSKHRCPSVNEWINKL